MAMTTEIDTATAQTLQLEGDGPFTLEGLPDEKLVLLLLMADQDYAYGDEEDVVGPGTSVWNEAADTEAVERFGVDKLDNIATYAVRYRASYGDLIDLMQRDPKVLLGIIEFGCDEA